MDRYISELKMARVMSSILGSRIIIPRALSSCSHGNGLKTAMGRPSSRRTFPGSMRRDATRMPMHSMVIKVM